VSSSLKLPLSKMSKNSEPSGKVSLAWMLRPAAISSLNVRKTVKNYLCGNPAGKYHRSPGPYATVRWKVK